MIPDAMPALRGRASSASVAETLNIAPIQQKEAIIRMDKAAEWPAETGNNVSDASPTALKPATVMRARLMVDIRLTRRRQASPPRI